MAQQPQLIGEHQESDTWTSLVSRRLKAMRYGTIQITVHDGRVVQVDCTERTRLPIDRDQQRQTTTD